MTQFGKCETCRSRKVKCDEKRPMCGSCAKKRRPCIYNPVKLADRVPKGGHVLAFPVDDTYDHDTTELAILDPVLGLGDKLLEVRNVYPAEEGQGTFHTLDLSGKCLIKRASTSPKIEPHTPKLAILCPQSSASERWSSIFGYEALSLNPLGDYVRTAILYAPDNRALDLACQYTLDSMFAFQRRDDASLMRAHKTGARALAALKAAVSSSLSNGDMRNVTIAMLLHFAAEHFIKLGSYNYVPHILAARYMLRLYRAQQDSKILFREIAGSLCMDEVFESIMNGLESSVFEDAFEPDLDRTSSSPRLDVAFEAAGSLMVQLPGLVGLVRNATRQGSTAKALEAATQIVLATFHSDADTFVKDAIETYTRQLMLFNAEKRPPCGMVLEFDSQVVFTIAIRYYVYRVIITGLLQRLWMHGSVNDSLDLATIEEADVEAATSISMCIHYATQSRPSGPLTALKTIFPLQMCIGTWLRVQRRQRSTETAEFLYAAENIDWTYARMDEIGAIWRYKSGDVDELSRLCDMFAGGSFHSKRVH